MPPCSEGGEWVIKKRTVFVLGAGANVPYGFSTGGGLLEKARALDLASLERQTAGLLHRDELEPLRIALSDNMLASIDAMLEHRRSLWKAGKMLMASLLFEEEAKAARRTRSFNDDWLSLIFENMRSDAASPEEFASNPVSFVTFNYDRLLEYRFVRGLCALYDLNDKGAWNALTQIPFLHLHGSLGLLPDQNASTAGAIGVVPFGPIDIGVSVVRNALKIAEGTIKIIHDADPEDPVFTEAQKLFAAADRILFFGFGFGKTNVSRLRTASIHPAKEIFCTTFDMTPAEISDSVDAAFKNHIAAGQHLQKGMSSIRQFLRDRIWLFR
jgi:hypothetical protein